MLISLDLPEAIIAALDRQVDSLRKGKMQKPNWPFADANVVVDKLNEEEKAQLVIYNTQLEFYNKYKKDWKLLRCSRSLVVSSFIQAFLKDDGELASEFIVPKPHTYEEMTTPDTKRLTVKEKLEELTRNSCIRR